MAVNFVPRNSALQRLEPYDYAVYLFSKYVMTDGDLEINLPWKCKKRLIAFFDGDREEVDTLKLHETNPFHPGHSRMQ